jgi:hypothetical protein
MRPAPPTDAAVLRDAGDRARTLLDAILSDGATLTAEPWREGQALYARAADATRRLLAELEAEAAAADRETNPPESGTARA